MKKILSLVMALTLLCLPLEGVFAECTKISSEQVNELEKKIRKANEKEYENKKENESFFEKHLWGCVCGGAVGIVGILGLIFYAGMVQGEIYEMNTIRYREREREIDNTLARREEQQQVEQRNTRLAAAGIGVGVLGGGVCFLVRRFFTSG
ncbi:MAG: hypothetical protein LBS61_03965, partial [Endomicrobium sp.]|jgi:hypothetical protein|nr:hypothetical protein [Endomicrobium sp.]